MKYTAQTKTRLYLAATASVTLSMIGCTTSGVQKEAQTDSRACEAFKDVISKSASNFDSLKQGAGVTDYDHTRWDTRAIFDGADCDVIGWGAGKTNYACTWTKPSADAARKDYQTTVTAVRSCLGASWSETAIPGVTGEGLRFSTKGSPSVVDLRMNKELATSGNWLTSLTVGSPINRNAK